jgi:4-hydroxybenzoate polyprenyltransferase
VNHPERPLPAGHLNPAFAVALYFTFLAAALFSTKQYVSPGIAFCYYALIAMTISYRYIVEWFPSVKAPYVAVASSVPVLIIAAWYPDETRLCFVAGAVLLLMTAREICMDIEDRDGDGFSVMHKFRPTKLAVVAFSIQAMGLVVLASQIRSAGEVVDLLAMTLLLGISCVSWFKFCRYKLATDLMKVELFVGLYFLI